VVQEIEALSVEVVAPTGRAKLAASTQARNPRIRRFEAFTSPHILQRVSLFWQLPSRKLILDMWQTFFSHQMKAMYDSPTMLAYLRYFAYQD
jgi:hypothetical protein